MSCAASTSVKKRTEADAKRLAVFEPKPTGRKVTVNYDPVDELLDAIVLRAGPSLRKNANRPRPLTGSRIVYGHTSPLRLEGNKVVFSRMTEDQKALTSELIESLVLFASRAKITTLPKTEQLVYWFNLHNLLVISEIAKRYPVFEPRRLTLGEDKLPFHQAPVVEVNGVPLSLEDIRVGIVYRYWYDARVFYGFFHGDLASPSVPHKAWRAATLPLDLGLNASEFINSLRGVRQRRGTMFISPIYQEARAGLFPNWPDDLRLHLRDFSERDVDIILDETDAVDFSKYEARVADVVGGRPHLPTSQIVGGAYGPTTENTQAGFLSDSYSPYNVRFPQAAPNFAFALKEYAQKFEELKNLKKTVGSGYVEIVDLPFDDGLPDTKTSTAAGKSR